MKKDAEKNPEQTGCNQTRQIYAAQIQCMEPTVSPKTQHKFGDHVGKGRP